MFKKFALTLAASSLVILAGCRGDKCCSSKKCTVVQEPQETVVEIEHVNEQENLEKEVK